MNKRISNKQALAVLLTVIVLISGYIIYNLIKENEHNNFYYVAFNANGGTYVNTAIVKANEKVAKPQNPTKKGYVFKYWVLDDDEYNFDSAVVKNIILEATWEEETN